MVPGQVKSQCNVVSDERLQIFIWRRSIESAAQASQNTQHPTGHARIDTGLFG